MKGKMQKKKKKITGRALIGEKEAMWCRQGIEEGQILILRLFEKIQGITLFYIYLYFHIHQCWGRYIRTHVLTHTETETETDR